MKSGAQTMDLSELSIRRLPEVEDRQVKGAIGKKSVRFAHFEVSLGPDKEPYVIVKSPQQIEELSELLKLEIFHTTLPSLPTARSPRGGSNSAATDEYLLALAAKGSELGESRSLRTFLNTNILARETGNFWNVDVVRKGFLWKKKGERAKLQKRYVVIKHTTLYYFKSDHDMNPAGSIRLDLSEVSPIAEGGRFGFTLTGGKKDGSRSFLTDTQSDNDRWMAEIETVKSNHDKAILVHGSLAVRVSEGRNLVAQNIFVQIVAEAQQHYTNVVLKSAGNPTWASASFKFEISSHRKFVYILVYDQPALNSATPSCLGEVSIPLDLLVKKPKLDAWMPLCPQSFFQSASGEIHVHVDYSFVPDETVLMEQKRVIALYHNTVLEIIKYFRAHPEGMELEGLFRVPGRMLNMQKMWDAVVQEGPSAKLLQDEGFEDVGGLMKMCLRNLPEPVFPFATFDRMAAMDPEDKEFFAKVSAIVNDEFSASARRVLRELLAFLMEVSRHEEKNKMTAVNLSVVFGPALIREEEDSIEMLTYLPKINKTVCKLILHHGKIEYKD